MVQQRFDRCANAIEMLSFIAMNDSESEEEFAKQLQQFSGRIYANYCNLSKESKFVIVKLFMETAEARVDNA